MRWENIDSCCTSLEQIGQWCFLNAGATSFDNSIFKNSCVLTVYFYQVIVYQREKEGEKIQTCGSIVFLPCPFRIASMPVYVSLSSVCVIVDALQPGNITSS